MITLNVQKREATVKAKDLRKQGLIPAVAYGRKFSATSIAVPYVDFIRAYNQGGETTLMQFEIDGKNVKALIHAITLDPVTNKVSHVDFYVPETGKKVKAHVPFNFVGDSAAMRAGGVFVKVMDEVEVEALPENLPKSIDADISVIENIGDSLHISQIKFPANVVCTADGEDVVATVTNQEEEKEETSPINIAEMVEVEKKGKKEEEGTEE